MAIKWISTGKTGRGAGRPRGERGGFPAALGLISFVLGLSLLLDGCAFLAGLAAGRGEWLEDCFESDYQNTHEFRSFIADRLRDMIVMGLGGPSDGYLHEYGISVYAEDTLWAFGLDGARSGNDAPEPAPGTLSDYGAALHEEWEADKNLLYRIEYDGKLLCTNAGDGLETPPQGYNFLLRFAGGQAEITKDGSIVDVYGDGYYTEESDWYLPGYRNFTLEEDCEKLVITMAAISRPQIFITGGGSGGYYRWSNYLYWLFQGLEDTRETLVLCAVELSAGLLLLFLFALLRRDKARAERAIARLTGKLWWEVKLLSAAALLLATAGRFGGMGEIVTEAVRTAYDSGLTLSQVFREYGWSFWEFCSYLFESGGAFIALFWGVYFLLFNDIRYNKRPWRHGIAAMLAAKSLKYPIQRRISRLAGGVVLLAVLPLCAVSFAASRGSDYLGWFGWIAGLPALLLIVYLARFSGRLRKVWTGIGALTDQIAAVRAGDLEHPLLLEEGDDLYQASDDLNHIQQGLQSALEERTRSERMKVELVTNVSHDLKTPLTSIISYADLLAGEELPPPAGEYAAILRQKAERLNEMVQDVFAISKAAAGQLPLKMEALDYGKLLRQTLADMAQPIEDSGLILRADVPEDPVPIYADGTRLYRVFQNLLGNALKYSLPGSRIYLTLRVSGDRAEAVLRNTSERELVKGADYTARFVRGDESRSDGGSGLGLSIAASFTEACGGELSVTTEADLFSVRVSFPLHGGGRS